MIELNLNSPTPPEDSRESITLNPSERHISGAIVWFGPVSEVIDVSLAPDFLTMQILGPSVHGNQELVAKLLEKLGFTVPKSSIYLKSSAKLDLWLRHSSRTQI